MKKALIITLSGNNNFGNKLQNYALQEALKNKKIECKTLWVNSVFDGNILTSFLRFVKHFIVKERDTAKNRVSFFKEFDKNIDYCSKKHNFWTNIKKLSKKYDYIIVGSDQVWNINTTHNYNLYFLKNVPSNKKISYACSFGDENFNCFDNYKLAKLLNDFKVLSVREIEAKKYIEKITERKDTQVSIDPTMLLKERQWNKVCKKPNKKIPKKYILNYFLGGVDEKSKKAIEKYAKENNCEIINILDKNDNLYSCGPSEFLFLEKNAHLICTDSFHSSVFSVIYNRPFVVFDRIYSKKNGTNSRINTLINNLKLENRKFNGKEITVENINHDYTEAYKILEKQRKESEEFLNNALDIE